MVSKGPEPVWIKMPKLTGFALTEAKVILEQHNLVLGVVTPEPSYRYHKEIVIRQDPGADSEILQGSIVNLRLALARVPSFNDEQEKGNSYRGIGGHGVNFKGIIIKGYSGFYYVLEEITKDKEQNNGTNRKVWECSLRGKLRLKNKPFTG